MAYLPLSTANLTDPVIDPAQGASPEDYFDVDTYTGTGSSHERSNFTFQPDFLWIKGRSIAENHYIVDAVRGAGKHLRSDQTTAESSVDAGVTSFDSDGFTLGASFQQTNGSPYTYVAWAWKANGSGVTNTDGSITSTVSANTTSGFSIITYTGNGTSGATIGHGLDAAPELYIFKKRNNTGNWRTFYTIGDGSLDIMFLDLTNSKSDETNISAPTSSVIELHTNADYNANNDTFVCYAFHSVEGFSKFGSYVGNGSADGPFVYTGFRPAFVMYKRTDSSGDWSILDTDRSSYNVADDYLYPHSSQAEASGAYQTDFLSNGFKLRGTNTQNNASGGTYIYMAFAENPFKYSNAR